MTDMLTREVAESLGISQITVRKQFNRGRLTGRRVRPPGSRWSVLLIDRQSVETYRRDYLGRRGPRKEEPK